MCCAHFRADKSRRTDAASRKISGRRRALIARGTGGTRCSDMEDGSEKVAGRVSTHSRPEAPARAPAAERSGFQMATRFKVITPAADTGSVDAIVRGCERAALSFLMSGDPSAPSRYYELCPSDYPDPVHAEIYVAIGDVSEQGIEPNPLTVTNRLIAK